MEPHTHRRVETRLANLLSSRRLRFPYVDAETGDFKWKKRFSLVVLNTLGSCLNIPILFYLSFYILAIYPEMDMKPLDMISVTFFSAALSILVDVFMGYILDKFIKPVEGGRPNPGLRNMVCVLGTIGLVTMLAIFFRIDIDKEEAPRQFRASLMLILLFFTFANCNSFKNAINYSPFQEDRRKLLYLEYFLKGFIIFIYVSSPLWAKFFSDDCACGATCKARPNSDDCTDCIDKCDSFEGDNLNHFRVVSIVFTCIFGFANLISQFAIKTRNDEDREDIPTTYNRRLVELWNNKFLLKTFFISLLEFSILFGFAIWVYYFAFNEIDISQSCLRTWGSSSYMCTRSYWLGLTVFLMFVLSALTFIVSLLWSFIIAISVAMSVLTFAAGILIITIPDGNTTQFCFIIIFMACFFASMAATKLVYSNGMYYDEYKSGVTQPNLPSCLFLLSVKLGFLLALALHLSLFYPQGFVRNAKHSNNKGFGAWVVVASFILLILKWRISKYDMKAFDKIQIAIERNINLQQDDIAFYDPIGKEPVRCPVTSFHTIEKKLIRLMYSLTPEDMMNVINGKQEKVQSRALTKMMIYIGVSVALLVVICVLGKYFDTPWGFLLSVAMLYLPVSIILILYEYNVWVAAGTLDSSKYKTVDRNILLRFILLLQPAH